MRATGKGSLSSILAVGLHITRIILIVATIGLAIALVVMPLISIFSSHGSGSIDDYFDVSYSFIAALVMLFVVTRLLEILKTLRFGSPFVKENADRFREVGYALLIGEGAKFVFSFFSLIFGADLDIEIEMIAWVAIIAVFVLSEVFREGARMKEEQDLTV
ncbi:MAG: DUF2975 domain-containing protein [Pseudomonadota bacterium]